MSIGSFPTNASVQSASGEDRLAAAIQFGELQVDRADDARA
jgi:hypothetical protein